jgi:hypothetical protein
LENDVDLALRLGQIHRAAAQLALKIFIDSLRNSLGHAGELLIAI